MCAETTETLDYKSTLNLPKTDFPMRAGLPKREPEWLKRWEEIGVYDRLRESKGRQPFTLCLLYTSPSPRDLSTSRMPSSA